MGGAGVSVSDLKTTARGNMKTELKRGNIMNIAAVSPELD